MHAFACVCGASNKMREICDISQYFTISQFLYDQIGSRRTSRLKKCYICVFVCFASKAVHIELAMDMFSKAFLNAFNRFIALITQIEGILNPQIAHFKN